MRMYTVYARGDSSFTVTNALCIRTILLRRAVMHERFTCGLFKNPTSCRPRTHTAAGMLTVVLYHSVRYNILMCMYIRTVKKDIESMCIISHLILTHAYKVSDTRINWIGTGFRRFDDEWVPTTCGTTVCTYVHDSFNSVYVRALILTCHRSVHFCEADEQ